jgi:hypothetical protein
MKLSLMAPYGRLDRCFGLFRHAQVQGCAAEGMALADNHAGLNDGEGEFERGGGNRAPALCYVGFMPRVRGVLASLAQVAQSI